MFRTESLELLARSRRPRLRDRCADSQNGARASLLQEKSDTVPADDPDDSGPRLSVTLKEPFAEIYALPAAQAEQTSGRRSDTSDQSKAPQSSLGASAVTASTPAPPDLLDPAVLRTMPPKVAAFMLYEAPDPPSWRRQETPTQREHRVQLEDCGSWVGE